jgi:hypothetical protein
MQQGVDDWEEEEMLDFGLDPMEGVDIWGLPARIGPFPCHAMSLVRVIIKPGSTTTTIPSLVLVSRLPLLSRSLVPFLPTMDSFGATLIANNGGLASTEVFLHSYPLSLWVDSPRVEFL